MTIKVVKGGSAEDENALHFSFYDKAGLGAERTIAIYLPSTNTIEFCRNVGMLPNVLKALRKYQTDHNMEIEPVSVVYW